MRFRPCIDIHDGKVKQIVGATLDDSLGAKENFSSDISAENYALLYKEKGLFGGHVILLNPRGTSAYAKDIEQARAALSAFQGGLQAGGGITDENAAEFLKMGASHVIVTSFIFKDGTINYQNLDRLLREVGKEKIVLDLSCKNFGGEYFVVTDRWQKKTDVLLSDAIKELSSCCDEFLVHAANVEGLGQGVDENVIKALAKSPVPATYAGGVSCEKDIDIINLLGGSKVDFTVGSALDLFGGKLSFEYAAQFNH